MATILVVEDGPINRRFLVALLRGYGHRLLEASDGEEALAMVRSEKPDVVLIDVLATGMGGCGFFTKIRAEPDLAPPRVVFRAPAYVETEARALADAFGAFFIVKPVNPDTLLELLEAALAAPQASPEGFRAEPVPADGLLLPIARKLQDVATNLERLNAQLDHSLAQRNAQLDVVRSALDQEIKKRILAEQELTQTNYGLRDLVVHDELTGLHNRRYLEESLGREESRALRSRQPLALMMIDIDNFKRVNDTLGHAAGDTVLREMGRYLLSVARGEDIVCRYGGEEFVLVMAQAPRGTIRDRAEALRRGVQALEIEHDGLLIGPITVSVGVGIFPDHGSSGRAVLQVADHAMYRAKQSGRNRVEFGGGVKA
jgi:diguanylate cyclase (GGDEF)-like protein